MSPTRTGNPAGEQLAQKGMETVLANELEEWRKVAMEHILALPLGFRFTAEWLLAKAGPPPKHPNSMGAMLSGLATQKEIRWTGEVRRSTQTARHSGLIRVWERTAFYPKPAPEADAP